MTLPKVHVVTGLGIGCHEEVAHAYAKAGAHVEIIHIKQLLEGKVTLDSQVLNLAGGFLHGDILGSGMCAANELEHGTDGHKRIKDTLIDYTRKGNVIYGQCNGFQLLVKTGLLPGISNHARQTVTLTHNDCGVYRVGMAAHALERPHFAFTGLDENLWLWCRHGEGKIVFESPGGLVSLTDALANRAAVHRDHVLLRYVDPLTGASTQEFPHNPNGSDSAIAGLANPDGHIFGHMAHTEVSVYASRDPRWFAEKDRLRRSGVNAEQLDNALMYGIGMKVFRNIVRYVSKG